MAAEIRHQTEEERRDALLALPELYVLVSDTSGKNFLNGDSVLLFSKKDYADEARDYLAQQLLMTSVRTVPAKEIPMFLQRAFWLSGAKGAIVDWGQEYFGAAADFFCDDLIAETAPDLVRSPDFVRALAKFLQELRRPASDAGRGQRLRALEDEMIRAFAGARFIIPYKKGAHPEENVKVEDLGNGTVLSFAQLSGEGGPATPLFTDTLLFTEHYDFPEWECHAMAAKELVYLPQYPGVIDPGEFDFAMNRNFVKSILNLIP